MAFVVVAFLQVLIPELQGDLIQLLLDGVAVIPAVTGSIHLCWGGRTGLSNG